MDTLEAFDAAARLGSFTAAAVALHLTPGAISRQMAVLEGDLGVALFTRGARGVELTPAGRRLHGAAAEALGLVLGAVLELRRRDGGAGGGGTVRVSVTPSFGARWLLPRLSRFRVAHPSRRGRAGGRKPRGGSRARGLRPRGALHCARAGAAWHGVAALAARGASAGRRAVVAGRPPEHPRQPRRVPFLHDTSDAFWRHWLGAPGQPELLPDSGTVFNDYNLAVGAAVSGLGVLVGRTALVADELRDGRLVEVVPLRVPSPRLYHLVRPAGARPTLAAAAFWHWLVQARAEASGEAGVGNQPSAGPA